MASPTTLEGFEDVTPVQPAGKRFDLEGFEDVTPAFTGPLITPRQKRRKAVADFDAGSSPLSVSASEFGRGVSKGILDIGSTTAGFGEALADMIGADSAKAWLKEKGDKLDEINRAIPLAVESFTDIESPGDIPAYVLMAVGKVAPQIALSAGAGLAAKGAATGAAAARRIAAGAFATTYPQEAGGMYRGTREETGKEAPGTALALGVPSAALDAYLPTRFLGKIFSGEAGDEIKKQGWRALVNQSFKEAGKSGLIEAGTEAAQESIAISASKFADSTYPLLTAKNAVRLIDAGLQGLIGGGVIGGVSVPLQAIAAPQKQETGGIDDTPPKIVPAETPPPSAGTPPQESNATQPIIQQPGAVTEPTRDVPLVQTQRPEERAPIVDSGQLQRPTPQPQETPVVEAQATPIPTVKESLSVAPAPQATIFDSGGTPLTAAPTVAPLAIPDWAAGAVKEKLTQSVALEPGTKLEFDAEWKSLTAAQKQQLATSGWSVTEDRNRKVLIGPTQAAKAELLRQSVLSKRQPEAAPVAAAVTPTQDAEYLAAVQRGDTATAQRMVDEAAKAAGFTVPVWHGTGDVMRGGREVGGSSFTEFRPSDIGALGPGIYVAPEAGNAASYAGRFKNPRLIRGYARINNPFKGGTVAAVGDRLFSQFPGKNDAETIQKLREAGYDAVWADTPVNSSFGTVEPEINILDPSQIKSADAVTRDASGAPIPLSQRFNPASPDIRYSTPITGSVRQEPNLPALFQQSVPIEGSPLRQASFQGETFLFTPEGQVAIRRTDPVRTATTLNEALDLLNDPQSGINPTVSRAMSAVLTTPGLRAAAEKIGFRLDLVSATNGLLNRAEGAFDPVTAATMLAYNATDPLTGPHEVAHSLERLLSPKQKALIRSERSSALARVLQRTNLTTAQREFLQAISTQERSSDWFRTAFEEQGTQILEFYPLINGSEYFAQSFASWFLKRHNASAGYRAFIAAAKDFIAKIYDALRRAFGAQGTMDAINRALISGDFEVTMETGTLLGTQDVLASMPQLWTDRQKADAAMSLRGIPAQRLAEAQQLANVQGGMVPDATAYQISQLSNRKNTPQGYAKQLLQFLQQLRQVAQSPAALSTVPRGTAEEKRVATVAANTLLGHHSRIVEQRQRFEAQASESQDELNRVMQTQQPKMVAATLKSQFLQQLTARLIRDYGDFVNNQARTLSAGQNYDAAVDSQLRRIQDNINDQSRNPAGLVMALEKIADAIPDTVLVPGVTPTDIANWVASNQPLLATLGQANVQFLTSPTVATSPLAQYADLPQRLATIKRIKADGATAEAAMQSFRTWFQQLHVGGRHASPLSVARAYAKFRMEQAHAADIATGIEERIDRLDRDVRGNLLAVDIINEMIASPEYKANLTLAANDADFVVTEMVETGGTGQRRYIGPISQRVYTVDLTPGKAQEQENLQQLTDFVAEAKQYLAQPDADPILARSYAPLVAHLERHHFDPWFSPENSALRRTWKIGPFNVPIGKLPGLVNAAFRGVGYSIQTPQALLEKIGGRAGKDAKSEWQLKDYVTEQFKPLNENKDHGVNAQNIKNLKAAVAHGFPKTPFGIQTWQDEVIEPIFASRQNDLGRPLDVGQKTPAGHTITALDMEAARTMKGFSDPIVAIVQNNKAGGNTLQAFNPIRISDEVAKRKGTRKAIAYGDMVMARHFHNWGRGWVRRWTEANTPAKKLAALGNRQDFVEAALRRVRETNPEYSGQSSDQTQQAVYGDIAYEQDQAGAVPIQTIDELLDRIAAGRFQALSPHQNTSLAQQRQIAQDVLFADITSDVAAFNAQVEEIEPWTKAGTTPTLAQITESQNSFTKARLGLVAPSSYYQYGLASDAAKLRFQHGATQIFQLRQIAAMERLLTVLRSKQDEWKKRVSDLQKAGVSERKALKTVKEQTKQAVDQGEFMADWSDLNELIKDLSVTLDEARRVAQQSSQNYYSEALGFVMNVQGTLASQLLSGVGSIWANLSGATNVTTALTDAHLGAWNPIFMGKQAVRRSGRAAATLLSGMANINNRGIVRALRRHGPAFKALADSIDDFADLWASGRMADERIGAVSPYQFSQRTELQSSLGRTGGRVEFDTPSSPIALLNRIQSLPGVRQFIEGIKATMPRATDMLANIANTKEVDRMVEEMKAKAIKAWSAREATGNPDWRNTSTQAGLLNNRELGFSDSRSARYFRDLWSPIGQIEVITRDYYEAQKTDPNAPLLGEGDYDALLLEYLKATNLATSSNRPLSGKGGQIRSFVGLFRGWGGWMWQQIDKLFQQHKGDEKNWLPAIAAIVMMMFLAAIVGAINREAVYEVKEVLTGETTKDIRLPAVIESGDLKELMRYTALAWANTLPYIGEAANRAFGGTSSRPFMDATAIVPILGLAQSAYDSMERIVVTGDPVYPMVDFARRWSPALQPVLNRLPVIEGDIAQRNALRAMQSTVPAGMEVREMTGGRFRGTPMTPVLRDIVSAAYTGDTARMNAAIARGIAMKEQQGAVDGAAELAQNLKGYMPQRRLFGRDITATEESRLVSRMTDRQRGHYDQSRQAFALIGSTLAGIKKPTRTASRRSGRRRRTGLGRSSGIMGRRRRQRRLRL